MFIPRPEFVTQVGSIDEPGIPDGGETPGVKPLEPRRAQRRAVLKKRLLNPGIMSEDVEQLTFEAGRIYDAFQPRNGWQDWLTSAIATLLLRISRCDRIERKLRDLASFRAIDLWEEDQALAVEVLAGRLAQNPSRVVRQLRETPAGIDWLIVRWNNLARVDSADWTEVDRNLALLLLGGNEAIDPTGPGFAQTRMDELRNLRDQVEEADNITRGLVEADLCDDKVAGLARLRRYSRSLHRQMKWYIDQFHVDHSDRWDSPQRQPYDVAFEMEHHLNNRRPAYSFAEPSPAHQARPTENVQTDETKPLPLAEREIDETKPLLDFPVDETKPLLDFPVDETKPFEVEAIGEPLIQGGSVERCRTRPRLTGGEGPSATIPGDAGFRFHDLASPIPVADYSNERGRNHSRPLQAGELPREYTHRQRAARQKTKRFLVEQT